MNQKVDKRLQEAIQSGFKEKQKLQREKEKKQQVIAESKENDLKKFLPKARAWVRDHLFEHIAEQEKLGYNVLIISDYIDGIPTEAIARIAKKIDGLTIWSQTDVTWEDSDFGKFRELRYYFKWKSADPNLNRNDR